jgi:gamma-butyrobetaine dioxygenase
VNTSVAQKDFNLTIDQQDEGLTVTWPDGSSRFFHYVWLRTCCYCTQCGNTYAGTWTMQPSDVPLDIKPLQVDNHDNENLVITWPADGHRSTYRFSWLLDNAYHEQDRIGRKHQPILWHSEISAEPPSIDFDQAQNSAEGLLQLLRRLRDYGFVVVRNGPKKAGGAEIVANLIGEMADAAYGKLFDLSPSQNQVTFGNTMNAVPPHTDEAYLYSPPGVNILHCVRPANEGGESLLVDGFYLANQMRKCHPAEFETLTTHSYPFHRIVPEDGVYQRLRARVITLDDDGDVAGFRYHSRTLAPLDVAPEKIIRLHAATSKLSQLMMDPVNQACFKLDVGEAVLFDNHRVMHARKAFSDPHRHMQICNISRESFHLKFRLTTHALGHTAEANQILAAGVAG